MGRASFSIVITSFNQSAFIRETVESALSQTCPAKQVIVVDDASTDSSASILKQYGKRITLVARHDNLGASAARNLGASMADGDYLVFLDGDDVLQPWALEVYERVIAVKSPKVILGVLLYFHGQTISGSSFYFRSSTPVANHNAVPSEIGVVDYDYLMDKDRSYRACASTIVVERHAFDEVDGWTETLTAAEDYDLMLKLGYCGRTVQIDSPATVCYRIHGANITRQVARITSMLCRVIERAGSGVYRGTRAARLDAYAFLGGAAFYWLKVALRGRCYASAFELFFHGLPLIVVSAVRRLNVVVTGRRPVEVLPGLGSVREGGAPVEAH